MSRLCRDIADTVIRVGKGMVDEADAGVIRRLGESDGLLPGGMSDTPYMLHFLVAECAVVEKKVGVVDECRTLESGSPGTCSVSVIKANTLPCHSMRQTTAHRDG